jgi:hypothetical protein
VNFYRGHSLILTHPRGFIILNSLVKRFKIVTDSKSPRILGYVCADVGIDRLYWFLSSVPQPGGWVHDILVSEHSCSSVP